MSFTKGAFVGAAPPEFKGKHLLLLTPCISFLLAVHYCGSHVTALKLSLPLRIALAYKYVWLSLNQQNDSKTRSPYEQAWVCFDSIKGTIESFKRAAVERPLVHSPMVLGCTNM